MHAGRVVAGLGSAAVFTVSARGALQPVVSEREAAVFRWFNQRSDAIKGPVWAVTQAGSLGSVVVTAAEVARRRGSREGLVVVAVGSGVWAGAKVIKPLVRRGRPDQYLQQVRVRGRPQGGLGYPSGHAAVSIALALIVAREPGPRALAVAWASLVGSGRMYLGAHLPLDVVGGFAVGAGAALAASAILRTATGAARW
jgi:membrane-associated phospholipid phosphatase